MELMSALTGRRVVPVEDPTADLPPHDPPGLLVLGDRDLPLAGTLRTPLLEVAAVLREPGPEALRAPLAFWVRLQSGWAQEFASRLESFELSWKPDPGPAWQHEMVDQLVATSLLASTPHAVLATDRQGRVIYANDQAANLLGEGLRHGCLLDCAQPEGRERLDGLLGALLDRGAGVDGEAITLVGSDGEPQWVLLSGVPYPSRPAPARLAILTLRDLTHLEDLATRPGDTAPPQAAIHRGARALLRSGRGVRQVAETAAELTTELLGAPLVALYARPRRGADLLTLQALRLPDGCDWEPPAHLGPDRLGPTVAGRGAVWSGHEVPCLDLPDEPAEHWLVAAVGLDEGRPGAALLAARSHDPWTQADRDLLAAWAEEVSLHLELATAHEQLAVQLAAYRRLLAVALSLQQTTTLDEVLKSIAGFARETIGGEWSYVHLLSAEGDSFERLFGPVAAEGVLAPMPLPPRPQGISWQAIRSRSLVEARAAGQSAAPRRPELAPLGIKHSIAVPLLADDRAVGVLVVDRSADTPLAETQCETLEVFATHAAAAVVRAELRERVAASAASYRALFEHSSAAVVVLDWDGWIILANARFEELTGYSREEVEGVMKAVVLAVPDQWRRISQNRTRRLAGDTNLPETYEFDFVTAEGQRRRARMSVAVVPQTRETVVTLLDVTREKQLQRQLAQVEKAAAIGQLVAGVAHELNNPLAAIMGSVELALAADPPARLRDRLERILEQSQRCRRIIANLLLFARETQVERVPVDVNAVVLQTVELQAYELAVDNVELVLRLAQDLPYINGDPARLQQVLLNLIINAYQAMRPQGCGTLTVTTKTVGNTVRLIVEDTGPGIKPEHLSRVFDPFFSTKPAGEGTGMGLSVSLGIIQDMAGEVWAENRVVHGARFVVSLPAARFAAARPAPKAADQPPAPRLEPVRGCRLLVVDDEPAVRDVIETALSAEGYVVHSVGDAATALEALQSGDFDAVICDLRLPGLNGQRFYQRALELRPALARRFIFITGDTVSDDSRQFLRGVSAPSLSKPFQLQELHGTIAALLRGGSDASE